MPKENEEIKKQTIDIVISPAEKIKDRNNFDQDISLKVVPKRVK